MADDEEIEVLITKEGYLNLRKKKLGQKSWHLYWFTLVGSSLYFYKNSQDHDHVGVIQLKGASVEEAPKDAGKPNAFTLKNQEIEMLLAANDEPDYKNWLTTITEAFSKDSCPPPEKDQLQQKGKEGLVFRAKKNMVGKAATSSMGKKAMKQVLPEELTDLLNSLHNVIEKKYDAKKAKEIENNIRKILLKAYLQVEKKSISTEDLVPAMRPLREAFELIVKINDNFRRYSSESLAEAFKKAESLLKQVESILTNLLRPYLKPQNMVKLNQTFNFLASTSFLKSVWEDDDLRETEDVFDLSLAMSKFSSFHIYSDKEKEKK